MESEQITQTKKRTLTMMHESELAGRIKSKQDIMVYLEQHRKYEIWPVVSIYGSYKSVVDDS